jgi:2-polyprenyl-3-methyl-5-hydroxy-6-metoxy-1,4-benzoquinol methylase
MVEVSCNLCGRDDWRVRFPSTTHSATDLNVDLFRCTTPDYGSHAQIVECNHCGLVYANPRWSADELEAAYAAVEDETYVSEREGREITFEKHLRALEQYTGPANGRSLLDVGAYIGVFVETALAAGWQAEGVEPSAWAVAQARQRHLTVHPGTLSSPELNGRRFDVITLWDVIEHVADPMSELQQAFDLLEPGGWLAVHTMNIDSLTARIMGARWPWLMDMHLYYFSQATLSAMLSKVGYEVMWSGTQGRYLRLGYLGSRLRGMNKTAGTLAGTVIDRLALDRIAIPVNSGDLFTVYGRRP